MLIEIGGAGLTDRWVMVCRRDSRALRWGRWYERVNEQAEWRPAGRLDGVNALLA